MDAKKSALVGLLVVVLLFLGVTVLADNTLHGARIDLTENHLFTLSPGTKKILNKLEEPISLTFYFSRSLAKGRPQLQAYGNRVREMLEEYRLHSHGKVKLEVLDPEPFSEAEDQARKDGVSGVPLGQGEQFYFGLVGTNSTDGHEVIPFFDPSQEQFLEYDISKLIHKLSVSKRPVVGLLTTLPLQGQAQQPRMPQQSQARPWGIMREIKELFDVKSIPPSATALPDGIDILLIIHPKKLNDDLLHSIDDYVMGGGTAVVCEDPLCEADIPPGAQQNPSALMQADRSSNLNTLLGAWGVTMNPKEVVIDLDHAMRGQSRSGQTVPYVQYLALDKKQMDQSDAVSGGLSLMNMGTVGALKFDDSKGTTWTPLVWTGDRSSAVAAARLAFFPDPEEFVAGYVGSGGRRVVAARISGKARSAFAPAPAPPAKEADTSDDASKGAKDPPEGPAKDASKPKAADATPGADDTHEINVLVVADCDFLADRWWEQEMRLGNMVLGYQKQADNADFLVNALDNMAGSTDLISLRARGTFSRPFTLVEKIRHKAEAQYLAEAQDLQKKQRETQDRIRKLQAARPDSGDMILTPEQEAEIKKFQDQLADTNAQLRDVRYKLRKNVEQLGTTLKVINTVLAPALVALGAVGLGAYRAVRRRTDRRSMAGKG